MSFLGIRGSPTLHRQLTSPRSQDFNFRVPTPSSPSDVSQDSKDVLVQRLADLSARLAVTEDLADEDVSALHVDVDRMERVLGGKPSRAVRREPPSTPRRGSFSRTISALSENGDDSIWGPPSPVRSPARPRSIHFSNPPSPITSSRPALQRSHDRLSMAIADVPSPSEKEAVSTDEVQLLSTEAEKLVERLTKALEELKSRSKETSHLHDLLVLSSDAATSKIAHLENQVKEIHDDHETLLSKLSFLRIQLRALEVQGSQYIPFGEDADLSTSIMNWKLEWADVDMRTRKSKKKCEEALEGSFVEA